MREIFVLIIIMMLSVMTGCNDSSFVTLATEEPIAKVSGSGFKESQHMPRLLQEEKIEIGISEVPLDWSTLHVSLQDLPFISESDYATDEFILEEIIEEEIPALSDTIESPLIQFRVNEVAGSLEGFTISVRQDGTCTTISGSKPLLDWFSGRFILVLTSSTNSLPYVFEIPSAVINSANSAFEFELPEGLPVFSTYTFLTNQHSQFNAQLLMLGTTTKRVNQIQAELETVMNEQIQYPMELPDMEASWLYLSDFTFDSLQGRWDFMAERIPYDGDIKLLVLEFHDSSSSQIFELTINPEINEFELGEKRILYIANGLDMSSVHLVTFK